MRVYFLRHGESLSNAAPDTLALPEEEGDVLSERGELQAEAAAERIAELDIERIVCSPLGRARQTAAVVAKYDRPSSPRSGTGSTSFASPPTTRPCRRASRSCAGGRTGWRTTTTRSSPEGDGESFADLVGGSSGPASDSSPTTSTGRLLVGHGIFCRFMFAMHAVRRGVLAPARGLAVADRLAELRPLDLRPRRPAEARTTRPTSAAGDA